MDSYGEVRRVRHATSEAAGHDIRKLLPRSTSVDLRSRTASSIQVRRQNNAMHTEPPTTRFPMVILLRRSGDRWRSAAID